MSIHRHTRTTKFIPITHASSTYIFITALLFGGVALLSGLLAWFHSELLWHGEDSTALFIPARLSLIACGSLIVAGVGSSLIACKTIRPNRAGSMAIAIASILYALVIVVYSSVRWRAYSACAFRVSNSTRKGIHEAVRRGDAPAIFDYLNSGADANAFALFDEDDAPDYRPRTALIEAVCSNRRAIGLLLIRSGADTNALGGRGSALSVAAARGDLKFGKLLLDNGANPNLQTWNGTPLEIAASHGNVGFVRLLLERGATSTISEAFQASMGVVTQVQSLIQRTHH